MDPGKMVSSSCLCFKSLTIVASYLSRGHGPLSEDHKDDLQVVLGQQLLELVLATEQGELEGHLHPVIAQPEERCRDSDRLSDR